ncbi:uncharacterized protein BX663DRAFT_431343 [Cokeromyces recurvatus]|uniref:uncharacterized protein n=1 Tax=Cokeromyces recurvatus TaxID=90255 RepID=UPI00221FD330|nr:uncharacterized protein BX663DRAFT_431343 [Cokeromyces recurvatus]KAI7904512.1 hypothetical protein BX663DRAFT_431343 [Cokeromyces recurvatus]
MGIMLWLVMAAISAPHWQKFPFGYLVVFFIALVSKMLASNVVLKKASISDSIWAIVLGCCLRNFISFISFFKAKRTSHHSTDTTTLRLPSWLKIAQQTELYIATSLVLLCIDINVLRPLAPRALFVSWIDTPILFMVVACFGWTLLKMDPQIAIILSGATFICGSSAAIALGSSMGVPPYKTAMPIAIISIFTIPSIIALPYIAKELKLSPTVSGAWFGGCVDSTGAVIAAASIYGDIEAINTSAVVKMMQNILIGPLSVIMAWAWSKYELNRALRRQEEEELLRRQNEGNVNNNQETSTVKETTYVATTDKQKPKKESAYVLLWKRFPKFVIGFIVTAVLFNTTISDPNHRSLVNSFCFYVSEWFSTLSFVSIGMGLELNEMKQNMRSLGKLVTLYIIAQMVDIVITCLLAWTAFTYL